jgi:hypothetical protein
MVFRFLIFDFQTLKLIFFHAKIELKKAGNVQGKCFFFFFLRGVIKTGFFCQ